VGGESCLVGSNPTLSALPSNRAEPRNGCARAGIPPLRTAKTAKPICSGFRPQRGEVAAELQQQDSSCSRWGADAAAQTRSSRVTQPQAPQGAAIAELRPLLVPKAHRRLVLPALRRLDEPGGWRLSVAAATTPARVARPGRALRRGASQDARTRLGGWDGDEAIPGDECRSLGPGQDHRRDRGAKGESRTRAT
jgi:hypothetical protein